MKYLIVGSGGTGGCVGAALARQGRDVDFIARGAHLAKMKENGLTVRSARLGHFTVSPVSCFDSGEYTGSPDVIFVCVKYPSIPQILPLLRRICRPDTVVIPLLNVFTTGRELQKSLPGCVADGCMYIYSMVSEPGVVVQPTGIFRVFFGYRRGQTLAGEARFLQVQQELRQAGIDAGFVPDIESRALQKFSFVSPLGAAGLYWNSSVGAFAVPGEKQDFFLALMREVFALAGKMEIALPQELESTNLSLLLDMEPEGMTSLMRDVKQGKPSEFDGLIARVSHLGRQSGIKTPFYDEVIRALSVQNIQ